MRWQHIDSFDGNRSDRSQVRARACPICQSLHARTVLVLDEFQFFSDSATQAKRVDICEVQCLNCHALYLNPVYSTAGFPVLFAEAGQSYGASEGRPQEQIDWLNARGLLKADSTLLDAGCYDGGFLAHLPQQVQRIGVDIDRPAIERGRARHAANGIRFVQGDFETFKSPVKPDCITMFHVLEHLPQPVAVLENLRANAHDATRLVVEVPILEKGSTNDINGFFSVQHTTHFSRASLRNALGVAGWAVEEWFEQSDYNGCRVLARPGAVTQPVGAAEDVTGLHAYLASWHGALADVNRRIAALPAHRRCVLWGGGMHTEFLYQVTSLFRTDPAREYAIVDSDPLKQGKSWRGVPIQAADALADVDWQDTLLVISSYGSQDVIAKVAADRGVPSDRIVRLYDHVDVY